MINNIMIIKYMSNGKNGKIAPTNLGNNIKNFKIVGCENNE